MMTAAAISILLAAESLRPTFDKAIAAHDDQRYEDAIQIYERLINEGVEHADVFYNLGNAYAELDRLGPAIANYQRALSIRPGMAPAKENYERCIAQARRGLAPPLAPSWQQALLAWSAGISTSLLLWLLVGANAVFWGVAAMQTSRPIPYGRTAATILAIIVAGAALAVWARANPMPIAVASQEMVPVRYGTSEEEPVRFELYDGDQIAVEDVRAEWIRVRTVEGERGWARAAGFTPVTPPYDPAPPMEITMGNEDDV